MNNLFARFVRETEGQDIIEYAILAALLGIVSYTILENLGGTISGKFTTVNGSLSS